MNVDSNTIDSKERKVDKKPKKILKELLPYIIILIVVILIRSYFVTPVKVSGPSMQPTLKNGETLILNKKGKLERFKIVVLDINNEYLIKRIIGMPGDKIEVIDNKLYINDEETNDSYGDGVTQDFGPIELNKDEYFVMGDNREDSTDSRIFGPIKSKIIIGTTNFRFIPFTKMGKIDH